VLKRAALKMAVIKMERHLCLKHGYS